MPSVVIIHAAEDSLPARALSEKLRIAKLTPVMELGPGEPLQTAVRDAAVVVALWSPRSVERSDLIDAVAQARRNGGVIHARMQNSATPNEFSSDTSIDLTGWRGEDSFPGWRDLAKAVTAKAGVPNLPPVPPPPPPGPPSGFFQPGIVNPAAAAAAQQRPVGARAEAPRTQAPRPQAPPPPRPQAATQQRQPAASPPDVAPSAGGGRTMIFIITFIVVAILGAGGYFFWQSSQGSQAAAAAWEQVEKNDASALRAFIAGEPGEFRDEAQAALSTLEEQSFDAAQEEDSIEAFQGFLSEFPDSDHALAARGRIAELESLPPVEEPLLEVPPTEPVDPDLVPPAAIEPPPGDGGPVTLTPPTETAPQPPTN
jgi:hypothetical protein